MFQLWTAVSSKGGNQAVQIFSVASPPSFLPWVRIAVQDRNNPRNLRHFFSCFAKVDDSVWADPIGYGSVSISPSALAFLLLWNGGNGGACLIAWGFGIPALVSIADHLCEEPRMHANRPHVHLVHTVRHENNITFLSHFQDLQRRFPNFHETHTVTQPSSQMKGRWGRINLSHGMKLFCVFGSPNFFESVVKMLLSQGVWLPIFVQTIAPESIQQA